MAQTGRPVELPQQWRQFDAKAPFVGARVQAAGAPNPVIPPGRHACGDRFDNQNLRSSVRSPEQRGLQGCASIGIQLVEGPASDDRVRGPWNLHPRDIAALQVRLQPEGMVSECSFTDGPGMNIDSTDGGRRREAAGPRGARSAGAASHIQNATSGSSVEVQTFDNPLDRQKMERAVIERICRALACGIECRLAGEPPTPLDVVGRQCTQRSRYLREREVCQMSFFEIREPGAQHA